MRCKTAIAFRTPPREIVPVVERPEDWCLNVTMPIYRFGGQIRMYRDPGAIALDVTTVCDAIKPQEVLP